MAILVTGMKKVQSKMKAIEWSQQYTLIFKMLNGRAAISIASYGIWPKLKPNLGLSLLPIK